MSILEHHFPPLIAEKYGVNAAILLRDIYHWCETNRCNDENFHEGRWWTYQTIKGLCLRHTYWTKNQVEHIIRTCREKGALLTGHFSEDQFDRTSWYALTDEALALFEGTAPSSEISEMEFGKSTPTSRKNQKCYIDKYKTKDKTNNPLPPKNTPEDVTAIFDGYAGEDAELRQRLADFQECRKQKKKPLHTARAARILLRKLDELSGGDRRLKLALLDNAILHSWESVYPLKADELPQGVWPPGAGGVRPEGGRWL